MIAAAAVLVTVVALVQALHRARQGRCALLKWRPAVEALQAGGDPYGYDPETGREGFPTLPVTALVLAPFLTLSDVPAAVLWASFKLALAWVAVWGALRLAGGRARDVPPAAVALTLALSLRPILSDVNHGNVNLPLALLLVAGALAWSRGNDWASGMWLGAASAFKATPLLFLAYFAWKRSWRATSGMLLGLALAAFALPGLVLGQAHNARLVAAWWQQMAEPYVAGTRLDPTQTEHINQSLLGVLARLGGDVVAIPARATDAPGDTSGDVRVNVASWSPGTLRFVHRAVCAAVLLAWLARARPRRGDRVGQVVLGEWALGALAMLLLSERSWKQHYVTLFLPLAFLAWRALAAAAPAQRRLAWAALAASALAHGLSGSGLWGAHASDLLEAWGVFLWGALALFVAVAWLLGQDAAAARESQRVESARTTA